MSIRFSQKTMEAIFGKKKPRIATPAERKWAKFHRTHTQIGERIAKDHRGHVVSRVPIWHYHGWLNGHKEYK